MKITIDAIDKTIIFHEGHWCEIIELLKTYDDFLVIDERGLIEEVHMPMFPNWPFQLHPEQPYYPHTINCGDTNNVSCQSTLTGKVYK